MDRWLVVLSGLLTAVAVAFPYVASANLADAACTADPAGIVMPEHDGRSLELHLDGWDCVLRDYGGEVATARLGWWPHDPTVVGAQLEKATALRSG